MYAIRSYYGQAGSFKEVAGGSQLVGLAVFLRRDTDYSLEVIIKRRAVITSYSIHYTKLYDPITSSYRLYRLLRSLGV